jgi:hypothetical protein
VKRELRSGTIRHVSMRIEDVGRMRRLVAYFSLDEQPARFVCDTAPSRSHKRLPAPFALGDPLKVGIGRHKARTLVEAAACGRD